MTNAETLFEILFSNTDNLNLITNDIRRNANGFIKLFLTPSFQSTSLESSRHIQVVLKILGIFYKFNKFGEELFEQTIFPITKTYIFSPHIKLFQKDLSIITYHLFKYLNTNKHFSEAFEIFNVINKMFDSNVFINTKAYSLYLAYHIKNYSEVKDLLSIYSVDVNSESYNDHIDYCMFEFFRGLHALSERNFFKASIHFLCVMKVRFPGNLNSVFEMESLRRLILLSFIVDSVLKKTILETLNKYRLMHTIKPVLLYDEFYKLLINKNTTYNEVDKFFKESKVRFVENKTKGLVKICIKEFLLNKVSSFLKTYKRIKIEKICSIIDIECSILIKSLKQFSLRNKINVKINEKENTLEVLDEEFDEKMSLVELKSIYSNMNNLQFEVIQYSSLKLLNSEKKLQSLKSSEKTVAIEVIDDFLKDH